MGREGRKEDVYSWFQVTFTSGDKPNNHVDDADNQSDILFHRFRIWQ